MLKAAEITLSTEARREIEDFLSGPLAADAEFELAELPLDSLHWFARETLAELGADCADASFLRKTNDGEDNWSGSEHPDTRMERFQALVAAFKQGGKVEPIVVAFSRLDQEPCELFEGELTVAAAREAEALAVPALMLLCD